MARQVLRVARGNDAMVKAYTGPAGELIMNTSTGSAHVQDGQTAGGFPLVATPFIDVSRTEIPSRIIPLRSFICGGFSAIGDGGAGARYIRGAAGGPMAIQDLTGAWWQLDMATPVVPAGWWGVVANDPSKATQNGVGINAAMAALDARRGGVLQLPGGDVYTDRTIDNRYSHVLVRGVGKASSHDAGSPAYGTRIIPTGAFTVLRHRSQTAAERGVAPANNAKNTGGGFVDIMATGAGLSPRIFHCTSIAYGVHRLYCENAVSPGTETVLYDCLPDYRTPADGLPQQLGEAGDNQLCEIDIEVRQDGGLSANLDGIVFDGVPYGGNTSLCYNIKIKSRFVNGIGVRLVNADNLNFERVLLQKVGTSGSTVGFVVQAGLPGYAVGSINIQNLAGNIGSKVEALADRPGATLVGDLRVNHLDGNNGTPVPTGPHVMVEDTNYPLYQTTNKTLVGLAVGNDAISANAARAFLNASPAFTIAVDNSAGAGIAYLTNTAGSVYFQRVDDASNDFQFFGPGNHSFATAVSILGGLTVGGPTKLASYTVATLPAATAGSIAFASNGRKVGEAAGAGTGCLVCSSNGAWRRVSDDSQVAA